MIALLTRPHRHHRPATWLLLRDRSLITQLTRRDVTGRYRGSALGIAWSLITPLFMLAVYTFVFGTIFKARWAPSSGDAQAAASTAEFAIILFAGLIVFQLFAEVVNRAPGLILSHVNYVKKVVFPLEVLPVVALGSALFHAGVSFLVLVGVMLAVSGHVPATALLVPLILVPLAVLVLGLGWLLAALGVFLRDISQVLGPAVTALLFLSPIFFPSSALPEPMRPWIVLNPIAVPVEQVREVLIWGNWPDWTALAVYFMVAIAVAALGLAWFQKTRKGFADVL